VIARISIISFFAFIFLMVSVIPATAGDDDHYRRDRDHRSDYYAPNWRYDTPGHDYRRFDRDHRRNYENRHDWRNSFYDDSYDDYRGPLSRERLVWEINSQGYFWVYNIRPSHRHNYVTAIAFDRRYGGRSVYLRVNQYTGHIFYLRYN